LSPETETAPEGAAPIDQMGTWLFQRLIDRANMIVDARADGVEGIVFALDCANRARIKTVHRRVIPSEVDKLIFNLRRPSGSELVLQASASRVSIRNPGIFGNYDWASGAYFIIYPAVCEPASCIKKR
jgi:hypothetical protein